MPHLHPRSTLLVLSALMALASGCAGLGLSCDIPAIPARKLPPSILGRPRSDMLQLSFTRLRQDPNVVYRIGAGDVLLLHVPVIYPEIVASSDGTVVRNEERV